MSTPVIARSRPAPVLLLALAALFAVLASVRACADDCAAGSAAAAATNAASLDSLAFAPFGRAETGWAVYAPRISAEIGTRCSANTPGFAAALGRWQAMHGARATGVLDPPTFMAMKTAWQRARPFVRMGHMCPDPPPLPMLATARADESYGGKSILILPAALDAYRQMVAAARAADPEIARDKRNFQIFSAYRDPAWDAARCAAENNCQGIVRAACSAHRTGFAVDLWVGRAPGLPPDSTADANRRAMVATPAYRWLVANARRYGFVNYAFEPWHWEWTGDQR